MLLSYDRWQQKGQFWQNDIWHGSVVYGAKVWNWIPPCRKNAPIDIHQCLLNIYGDQTVDVSTLRRLEVSFQWWWQPCERQAMLQTTMCSCHTPKWRVSWSAHPLILGIMTRKLCTEYWKQLRECWIMAKFVPDGPHKHSHTNTKNILCKFFGTFWTDMRLKVIVSWIASLQVMRHGITTTSQRQNGSTWSGDMNSPSKKKFKLQPSVGKVMCTAFWDRKGVILPNFLESGHTINSDRYIAVLTKLKARTSRVQPEKKTTFLLQHDNSTFHTSLKTVEHIANLGWTILPHHCVILIWCFLNSICSEQWKMECTGSIFLAVMLS